MPVKRPSIFEQEPGGFGYSGENKHKGLAVLVHCQAQSPLSRTRHGLGRGLQLSSNVLGRLLRSSPLFFFLPPHAPAPMLSKA